MTNQSWMNCQAAGKQGAIASGGCDSVRAGMAMLKSGGNAADAAAACILALAVTDHGYFAMGGEIPFIIYDAKKGEVKVLSGLGRAPYDPSAIEWYMKNGIPSDGNIKAAPVPAAVDLCITALRLYGTMSFEQAITPTLDLLKIGGRDWYPRLIKTLERMIKSEQGQKGSREDKLQAATDRFYRGDIADELEEWYAQKGHFMRKEDLAAHVTRVEDPVTAEYRGYTVCKCGPWTQGPYLLQTLRLLEGFNLKQMGQYSADYIHVLTEALKLGMADRDLYYADPEFKEVPLDKLLSDKYTKIRRELIDMKEASQEIRPGDPYAMKALKEWDFTPQPKTGGTTTCVAADKEGNLVSATPSCNVFGDKGDGGLTGVTHGNRLRCLNTCKGHPNVIEPGKRPQITLTPTLVLKEGKPVIAISVAGGDKQDQTTLNVFLNHIEFGMSPAQAVTTPRFSTSHHENTFSPAPVRKDAVVKIGSLEVNPSISPEVREELRKRGHQVTTIEEAVARPVMLLIDHKTGMKQAAGDPAAFRYAEAY